VSPIILNGRATRPSGLHAVLDSQRGERYQATDPTFLGPANPPLAWRRALPLFAAFAVLCVAMFCPWPVQIGVAVGTFFAGLAALWRVL
jgi:hypothetical protein